MPAKITFGSDPEFMIINPDGGLQSAIGLIKGTSERPVKHGNNNFYQDNVLGECTIKPGESAEESIANFQSCFQMFAKMISPYKLVCRAAADYPREELKHPLARVTGCKREWCAYTLNMLPKHEEEFLHGTLRTAGGHVHIGAPGYIRSQMMAHYYVRMLDLFLGIPAVFMNHDPSAAIRRRLYGGLGSHRTKSYGIEYRVLDNFWLSSPSLVAIVYDIAAWTVEFVNDRGHEQFWKMDQEKFAHAISIPGTSMRNVFVPLKFDLAKMQNAVDNSDREAAKLFMDIAASYLPQDLMSRIAEASKPCQYNFYKEWNL